MSKLASDLAKVEAPSVRVRRGPINQCNPLYGDGDVEDWRAIEALRAKGMSWREVQDHVDRLLGVTTRIHNDKFRRHWRRKCFCWEADHDE